MKHPHSALWSWFHPNLRFLLKLCMKITSDAEGGPYLSPHLPPKCRATNYQDSTQGCISEFCSQLTTVEDALAITSIDNRIALTSSSEHNTWMQLVYSILLIYSTMTLLLNSFHSWILLLQQNLPPTSRGQRETSGTAAEQSRLPGGISGQERHWLLTIQSFLSRILYQM